MSETTLCTPLIVLTLVLNESLKQSETYLLLFYLAHHCCYFCGCGNIEDTQCDDN